MADVTMLEAAKHSQDEIERTVTKIIVEASPVAEYLPFRTISGPAYRYNKERSLGSIGFRGVNGSWTSDAGVINPEFEPLVIMGGEVKIDKFEVDMMSNLIDLKAEKYSMKARQSGFQFSSSFFEGDSAVDPYSFDGLRKRLTGTQLMAAGATSGGDTLTLAMLDQLLDLVAGDNSDKILWMNDTLRRKITALVRAQTGSSLISFTQDAFGKQQTAYAGATIRLVRREDDGSSIFGFDEANPGGGSAVGASIYCTHMGLDYIHGIQGMSMPQVRDFGEVQAGPYHLGRLEWYVGMVLKHPRAAARLYGVKNA